jgi:uncharacterized protein (TIGR02246 family)
MHKFTKLFVLAVLALTFVSCARQPDLAAIRKTIEAYNAASSEGMRSGNTTGVIDYYAVDAVSMPPNMAPIKGKEAIKAWMDQMATTGVKVTVANFTISDLGAGGDVAFERGEYEMIMEMPDKTEMKDNGKYISIWKQQADGSWKVQAEIWNTNTPEQPPQTEKKK